MREIHRIGEPDLELDWVQEVDAIITDRIYAAEIRRLGRACSPGGGHPISPWEGSLANNGSVEAMNGPAKYVKRVAFGLTNWTNRRIPVLLFTGHPGWTRLPTSTPTAP